MDWYEKLNQYFPIEEMKSKEHMELLLSEKPDVYFKDEGENYVLMYAEMDDFIFIDYLFVSREARGKGIGKKLINRLKKKQKPIILEVEPIDYQDSDTKKRWRFYERENFKHAKSIGYKRRSLATNKVNQLEILYWSPTDETEESIFEKMKKTYKSIHTYKDKDLYGQSFLPINGVLTYNEQNNEAASLKEKG